VAIEIDNLNMADVLVSICIPTYNGEKYIEECLQSALNQTYPRIEIVICDDYSIDRTIEIVQTFQTKDNRIKLFTNTSNNGLSANWNKNIEVAQGEWIKFVFQDDVIQPDCIAKMMEQRDRSKLIVCEREFVFEPDTEDRVIANYGRLNRLYQVLPGNSITCLSPGQISKLIGQKFPHNFIGEPSSLLFSKECFSIYGGFLSDLSQMVDYEFSLRLAVNEGLCYLPKKLVSFRVHRSSTTQSNISTKYFAFEFGDKIILSYRLLHEPLFFKYRRVNSRLNLFFIRVYMYYLAAMALIFVRKHKQNNKLQTEYMNLVNNYKGIDKYSSFSIFFKVIDLVIGTRRRLRNYLVPKFKTEGHN